MYCKICGEGRATIKIFSINICKGCMNELTYSNVNDDKYEGYIKLIRILLGYLSYDESNRSFHVELQ